LRVLLEEAFEAIQSILLISTGIHPYLDLIEAFPDFYSYSIHDIDIFVLRTDGEEDSALPKLIAFFLLDFDLEASSADIVDVLPHGFHPLLKEVHVAV
jgi:hypothetical protein